ncbi:uncharacterized protein LOC115450068 isoform X3 [Manduca sexta]|uniref:uncharacterized protein LOC115450068 isoform X3 n=1 Tax=Manduca sexta TaxID=7130 RepID=UPI00188F4B1C|nr:uncharacterized protein LOC115450068 isoform X3 [Manduca sexta]
MVYTCFLCKWRGDKFPRRSYHKFPSNAEMRQKWLDIMGKSNVSIGVRTSLCSIHFDEDCFRYGLVNGRRILKDGSIPTLHLTNDKQEQIIDLVDEIKHPEPFIESSVRTGHTTGEAVQIEPQTHRKETEDVNINDSVQCISCARLITEFRYTCVQCSDLDLCGACEADRAHHQHYVLRIPADRPAAEVKFVLATLRRYLPTLDPKTVSEPDWDGPLSIKSEIKSECEDDEEMTPTVAHVSENTVLWAACEHQEHRHCFTNIGIKLESVNEGDSVHFSSADECDSSDGTNAMVGKGRRDVGTDGGTTNAVPMSSHTEMLDDTTSAKETCFTSVSSGHEELIIMESGPREDINQEESEIADNSTDHTPSKKSRSIKSKIDIIDIDDVQFMQTYRMSKRTAIEICNQIDKDLEFRSERVASFEQLLIALRYYATGTHLQKIASGHRVSISTASRIVKRVSSAIVKLKDKYIHMPTAEDIEMCQKEFCSVANFPTIIGCIDCTHVRITSPGNNCDAYKNKRAYFSLNVQTVVDSKLRIRHVVAHSPGSTSDARVFEDSVLSQEFEAGEYGKACLLGDSAYPLKKYLLTPYLEPTTEVRKRYNKSHSETRKVVETLYSMLKKRFPALAVGLRINLQTAVDMITACCILHNICVENGEDVPPPDIKNAVLEAHIEHGSIVDVYDKPGDDGRRNAIIRKYFSKKAIAERAKRYRDNKKKKQQNETLEAILASFIFFRRKTNAERIKIYRDKLKSKRERAELESLKSSGHDAAPE